MVGWRVFSYLWESGWIEGGYKVECCLVCGVGYTLPHLNQNTHPKNRCSLSYTQM